MTAFEEASDKTEKGLNRIEAIVIGASAGAIEALTSLLPKLPKAFPLPIMIVVHIPADKKSLMPELFQHKCRLIVKEAEDKEPVQGGTIYLAPPDYHLLVEPNRRLSLSNEEPVLFSRPSIDLLFESASDAYAANLLGIVLTGANHDGSRGLSIICKSGGMAWVQKPETALAQTMPQTALKACPSARSMNIDEMSELLISAVRTGST